MGGTMIGRRQNIGQPAGFLTRLARNRAGNTLAMMAFALVPLVGMAGSAIDTGRVYYVKVRLQQACDAGVLAGRKFMNGTDFDTAARQQAQAFFANNFRSGMMGSTDPNFSPVKTTDNQVAGTARAVVPMTLMKMMGFAPVTVSVACQAKLEIPNLDVMFVLDTTGSMSETNPGDTTTKIAGLRTAVISFYDAVEGAKRTGTRVRYGFVPYSTNVNVGMLLKPEWMVDRWTYQSREAADVVTPVDTNQWSSDGATDWDIQGGNRQDSSWYGSREQCTAPSNVNFTSPSTATDWKDLSDGRQVRTVNQTLNGTSYNAAFGSDGCKISKTVWKNYRRERNEFRKPNTNYNKPGSSTYYWNYKPVEYDVSGLKGAGSTMAGGTITVKIGTGHTMRSLTWGGTNACIEERQTVKQSNYDPLPSSAYDLDVDLIPTPGSPDTQWKPWIPGLVFSRTALDTFVLETTRSSSNFFNYSSDARYAPCPSPAVKLTEQQRSTFTTYVQNLQIGGNTYHDIGFLWGTRLLSPTGLFASENTTAPNGSAISRHLIFMTDGETKTLRNLYEAYGLSALDRRRTDGLPTDSDQDTIVANRLAALCTVAKRKNITVWVIAFGTTLTPLLENCASTGRAYQAANAAQLNQTFSNIASQIARLRVSE